MILSWKEAKMEIENGGMVWMGKSRWERQWTVTKRSRENKKGLKTAPICPKHAFSATEMSRQKVDRSSRQNTQGQKFEKNFLSVFRDWKVYPRVSRKLSRENLWVNLATGPSTREQVAKNDPRRRDWGTRLDIPATEPPKQGKTGFLKFSDFSNKILFKNT